MAHKSKVLEKPVIRSQRKQSAAAKALVSTRHAAAWEAKRRELKNQPSIDVVKFGALKYEQSDWMLCKSHCLFAFILCECFAALRLGFEFTFN